MSDIKLFRTNQSKPTELKGTAATLEKSLQSLIEKHLDTFLGVRFLASEYSTGRVHGGRIDTLGIDENGCPVIIEYKRTLNENVINQGLFYLDWLFDHKGDFKVLVLDRLGTAVAENIDWSAPRLVCIAGEFTKYDEHAIQQINRNIELIRYKKYNDEFLLLELVNTVSAVFSVDSNTPLADKSLKGASQDRNVEMLLAAAPLLITDLFESLKSFCMALGDDVQMKTLKRYFAFRRLKNFACAEVRTSCITIYLYVDPDSIELTEGFTRDVREIGHWGTGTLEIKIDSIEDLEDAKVHILTSYENS